MFWSHRAALARAAFAAERAVTGGDRAWTATRAHPARGVSPGARSRCVAQVPATVAETAAVADLVRSTRHERRLVHHVASAALYGGSASLAAGEPAQIHTRRVRFRVRVGAARARRVARGTGAAFRTCSRASARTWWCRTRTTSPMCAAWSLPMERVHLVAGSG